MTYELAQTDVYYNYKTKVQDLSLEGVITLNNIRFHKAKTGLMFMCLAGIGGTDLWYQSECIERRLR